MKDYSQEINYIIRNRRSIYPAQYSGERVDDRIIEKMLENAHWAPNHKHTTPWRFTVFTDEGLKQLGEFQSKIYEKVAQEAGNFDPAKKNKLAQKPLSASHVIAIMMKRDPKESVPEIEEIEAVACAVQNMQLTAFAYGIGCYWGSGGVTYMEEAKSAFDLDEKDKLLGFLYVGTPKESLNLKGSRSSVEDKVAWVR